MDSTYAMSSGLRISALDPAFPMFYVLKLCTPLNKSDAEFVDVIHTDAWFYGAPFSTGTVDFWPNGGKTLQPGCPKRNYRPLTDNGKLLLSDRPHTYFYLDPFSFTFNFQKICVRIVDLGGFGPRVWTSPIRDPLRPSSVKIGRIL